MRGMPAENVAGKQTVLVAQVRSQNDEPNGIRAPRCSCFASSAYNTHTWKVKCANDVPGEVLILVRIRRPATNKALDNRPDSLYCRINLKRVKMPAHEKPVAGSGHTR